MKFTLKLWLSQLHSLEVMLSHAESFWFVPGTLSAEASPSFTSCIFKILGRKYDLHLWKPSGVCVRANQGSCCCSFGWDSAPFPFPSFSLNPHKITFINELWEMQLSAACESIQNLLRWSWHFLLGERKKTDTGRQVSPGVPRGSHPETSHHWVACFLSTVIWL